MTHRLFELRESSRGGFEFPRMPGAARIAPCLVIASLAIALIFAAASITRVALQSGEGKTLAGNISARK